MLSMSKYNLSTLDRHEIEQLDKKTIMVIPTAAIEQHGYLPIATDTMMIEQLCYRLAQRHE